MESDGTCWKCVGKLGKIHGILGFCCVENRKWMEFSMDWNMERREGYMDMVSTLFKEFSIRLSMFHSLGAQLEGFLVEKIEPGDHRSMMQTIRNHGANDQPELGIFRV